MGLSDFKNAIITEDRFSGTFKKFDGAVQGSARGLDKLGGIMSGGGLAMLFGGAAGVAGVAAIGKTIWNLGELGAQSLTTKASFESLMSSVGQSPQLLNQMTAAAGGTITELQLMQQANTALAGTSGQLANELAGAIPQLIEAGRAAAMLNPSMGDAAFMTQSLITGIKRGSPMLIDNTGITLKLGEATEAYAESVGKSVNELTAQERSIAILRATLASSGTLIEQVGGNLDSMTSDIQKAKIATEELKTTLGEVFAPAVADAATGLAYSLQYLNAVMNDDASKQLSLELENQIALLAYLNAEVSDSAAAEEARQGKIAVTTTRIRELQHSMLAADIAAQKVARSLLDDQNASEGARFAFHEATVASDGLSGGLRNLFAIAGIGVGTMQTLVNTINGLNSAAAGIGQGSYTGFLGGVDVLSQQQYAAVTQQRINLESDLAFMVQAGMLTQMEADYQLQKYDLTVNNHIGTLRDQGKAIADVGNSYDDLKSRISGALRPTFDLSGLTGGLLGGAGGDTFDEAYKRLAAVALRPEELQIHANDANWQDTFQKAGLTGLSPEDAQARAKELVEAYSKGLDFSLIDKEAIKDSIRQAIKADELFQSMVDEIYAEMGKPKPELTSAGEAMGKQINAGVLVAAKNGGKLYNEALARAVSPYVADILSKGNARYQ